MEITVYEQSFLFLFSIIAGGIIGLIYDFFRSFKSVFVIKENFNIIFDILFIISVFSFLFTYFLKINGFDLRIYHIIGCISGFFLYYISISGIILCFFRFFLNIFKKILKILLYPVRFLCKIVNRVFVFIFKILSKVTTLIKKMVKGYTYSLEKFVRRKRKL